MLLRTLSEDRSVISRMDDRDTRIIAAALRAFSTDGSYNGDQKDLASIQEKLEKLRSVQLVPKRSAIANFFASVGGFIKLIFFVRCSEWYINSCVKACEARAAQLIQSVETTKKYLKDHFGQERAQKFLLQQKSFWEQILNAMNAGQKCSLALKRDLDNNLMKEFVKKFEGSEQKKAFVEERLKKCESQIRECGRAVKNFESGVVKLNAQLDLHEMSDLKIDLEKEKATLEKK